MKQSHVKEKNDDKDSFERISFLSHISHGIRTPLNSIMGFSKLMAQRQLSEDKQKDYIQEILNGGELLLQFIDNIIDLSQFQAKNYALKVEKQGVCEKLKEFIREFNDRKKENLVEDVTLYFADQDECNEDFFVTDIVLFKKAFIRLVNLVSTKYEAKDYEIGYKILADQWVHFFITPSNIQSGDAKLTSRNEKYSGSKDNSFDYFNFQVLQKTVEVLYGELMLDNFKHGFSFKIPIDIREFNHEKYF